MLAFTVEKDALRQGVVLGQQTLDLPSQLSGNGWAGIVVTTTQGGPLLDRGLVGELVFRSEPIATNARRLSVGDRDAPLTRLPDDDVGFLQARVYELPVAGGRPSFTFVELVLAASLEAFAKTSQQPARHRAFGFVALAGHGFSLAVPEAFDRYLATLDDGNAMRRFTTTEEGDELLAAGHFLPIWGVHQWDYRLVFCRGRLSPAERALLGTLVLRERRYPLDLGDLGRLDVLPRVPELQDTKRGLERFGIELWPGRFRVAISGFTTGGYGDGLIPTYLLELEPPDGGAPDQPLNGESLPTLFENLAESSLPRTEG